MSIVGVLLAGSVAAVLLLIFGLRLLVGLVKIAFKLLANPFGLFLLLSAALVIWLTSLLG